MPPNAATTGSIVFFIPESSPVVIPVGSQFPPGEKK
jgi:hypothetical protein